MPPIRRFNHFFSICSCTNRLDIFKSLPQMTGCRVPVLMSYHPTCAASLSVGRSSLLSAVTGTIWCLGFKHHQQRRSSILHQPWQHSCSTNLRNTRGEIQGQIGSTLSVYSSPADIFKCMFPSHWEAKWIRAANLVPLKSLLPANHNVFSSTTNTAGCYGAHKASVGYSSKSHNWAVTVNSGRPWEFCFLPVML